ncbi:MAG: OmpA family protein [Myxococcota bacterium]|jgi:outer membrane protein OmpA-like peptidoglycan-associated protein|nr:OmpA family protein [Myxococcota bacterium]
MSTRSVRAVALWLLLWSVGFLASPSARADEHPDAANASVDANPFVLDPSGLGPMFVGSAEVPGHLDLRSHVVLQHLYRPIVVVGEDGRIERALVGQRQQFDLAAVLGWQGDLEAGLRLPLVLHQVAQMPGVGLGDAASAGLGDLVLHGKWWLLDESEAPVSTALLVPLGLPTGNAEAWMGSGGVSVHPQVVGTRQEGLLQLGAALGWRSQPDTTLFNLTEANKITARLGVRYRDEALPWEAHGGLTLAARAASPLANADETSGELLGGGRWAVEVAGEQLVVEGGLGLGLLTGVPTPRWRAFLGVRYRRDVNPDSDADGLVNSIDGCPAEPEDVDGFEDEDGCPDPDNDQDGRLDPADGCPDEPEDMDGFEDEDGCPEADNDEDGIVDESDECPLEAEDLDGLSDEDGCPEEDSDEDGVLDTADDCPSDPEDEDGFEDEDGCPDPDDDGDGILDEADMCPRDAEDADGYRDHDGCPDPDCPTPRNPTPDDVDLVECPEPGEFLAVMTDEVIEIRQQILFKPASHEILPVSYPVLREVLKVLRAHPGVRIRIIGHTDSVGSESANLRLSIDRADAVMAYLLHHGTPDDRMVDRLEAEGQGEGVPQDTNRTRAGQAQNRRVEFVRIGMLTETPDPWSGESQ